MKEQKITKLDLIAIKFTMIFNNRHSGFIAFDDNKLRFFDREPSFGGAFITIEDINNYINTYDNDKTKISTPKSDNNDS